MSTETRPTVTRASVGLRSERGPVLFAVMLSTGLVAVDATILAAAVPAVVDDLGGLTQFPWLFSVYLLAQAVTVPLYAKLADLFGRKPVMLIGVTLFVVGSLLCGVAWSMGALIAFRAVQGIGAGAVQPIGMTILGDIYSLEERAKVQGYVASVWAVASLVGPTLGGVFADYLSWRWIFLVNLPVGLAAAWVFSRKFTERPRTSGGPRPRLDYAGAGLLSVGGVVLLLALLEGGVRWQWDSATSLTLFVVAVLSLVGFALAERRASDPVLPLWVFRDRVLNASMLGALIVGVLILGLSSYVPLYAQAVLGHGAVVAGLALAAMTIGLAGRGRLGRSLLPDHRLPGDGADGRTVRHRRRRPAAHRRRRQLDLAPRGALLRDGRRLRLRGQPGCRGGAVVGDVAEPRGGDRQQPVRALGRQLDRGRGVRRDRERCGLASARRRPGQPGDAGRRRSWSPPSTRSSSARRWWPCCSWPPDW